MYHTVSISTESSERNVPNVHRRNYVIIIMGRRGEKEGLGFGVPEVSWMMDGESPEWL